MVASNNELGAVDSLRFSLGVISDARPVITVAEVEDSISRGLRYFSGNTSDDYGFSRLRFVYRVSGETEFERITLDLPRGKSDSFYYTWDISGLGLMAGNLSNIGLKLLITILTTAPNHQKRQLGFFCPF